MPDDNTPPTQEPETERPERSSSPDDWPGIPGRSAENEQDDPRGRTDVTEAQRQLEAEETDRAPGT